jgi:hypothetical protein
MNPKNKKVGKRRHCGWRSTNSPEVLRRAWEPMKEPDAENIGTGLEIVKISSALRMQERASAGCWVFMQEATNPDSNLVGEGQEKGIF